MRLQMGTEMLHEIPKYTSHEYIFIVFGFNDNRGVWVQSMAY